MKKYTVILNAHGEADKLGEYNTKRDAVEAVQMYTGMDYRPNKYGEIGINHMIVKTDEVQYMGYDF